MRYRLCCTTHHMSDNTDLSYDNILVFWLQELWEKQREVEEREQRERREQERIESLKKKEKHEQSAVASSEVKQKLQVRFLRFHFVRWFSR